MNRRNFLKFSGLAGGVLALAGYSTAGFFSGRNKDGNTGYGRHYYGKGQFFNRKPFLVEKPVYEIVGKPQRIQYMDNLFKRNAEMFAFMYSLGEGGYNEVKEKGVDILPGQLKAYYKENPVAFREFFKARDKAKEQRLIWDKYKGKYHLADAWSTAHSSILRSRGVPAEPDGKPEVSDFKNVNPNPLKLKSSKHGSELIKKIAHSFGATLVGVAAIHDWRQCQQICLCKLTSLSMLELVSFVKNVKSVPKNVQVVPLVLMMNQNR